MTTPRPPEPVTLIVGMLAGKGALFDAAEERLAELYGPVGLRSSVIDFDFTGGQDRDEPAGARVGAARHVGRPPDQP